MPGPRILIVRLTAIGDVLHGLPVATALRRHFPTAHIAWAVEGRTAELLQDHPALDEVIALPRRWLKSPKIVWRLRRELRAKRFDIALDLQSLSKSAIAAWISGARRRIGFGGIDGRELSRWLNNERITATAQHVVDRNLELLAALDIPPSEAVFELARPLTAEAKAEQTIRSLGLGGRFAIINPGAGWTSKLWPPARFAEVARYLGEQCRLPSLVVWAGKAEGVWAEQIVAESAGHGRLAPATSLGELASLARRASLFVASDTGPLHLAAAVGAPCVGLFGPMPGERNGPYGSGNVVVEPQPRIVIEWKNRKTAMAPMLAISVEQVKAACLEVLAAAQVRANRRCA